MKKIALLLIIIAVILLLPCFAFAIDITGSNSPYSITNNESYTVKSGETVIISGTASNSIITCEANVSITINVLNIDNSLGSLCPIQFSTGTNFLEFSGSNSFIAGVDEAAISVIGANTKLTISDIDGNGVLYATGGQSSAGIGGGNGQTVGSIEITSGEIIAEGTTGAGIGTGDGGYGGTTLISGGDITAIGGNHSAGIGGGNNCSTPPVKIEITGGEVEATGRGFSAGIGSYEHCGDIIIRGGKITASNTADQGAGIGSGYHGNCNITIYGGEITATGYRGAGIGSGRDGTANITIYDGNITATSWNGAAIGNGSDGAGGGSVTIHGGTIEATTTHFGAGIGGGDECDNPPSVTITGGTITATGAFESAGIGGGYDGNGSAVTINGGTVYASGDVSGTARDIGRGHIGTDATHDGSLDMTSPTSTLAVFIQNERANSVDPIDPEPDYITVTSLADIPSGIIPPTWSFPYGLYYIYVENAQVTNPQTGNILVFQSIIDWFEKLF
jgi:hypothetical protein